MIWRWFDCSRCSWRTRDYFWVIPCHCCPASDLGTRALVHQDGAVHLTARTLECIWHHVPFVRKFQTCRCRVFQTCLNTECKCSQTQFTILTGRRQSLQRQGSQSQVARGLFFLMTVSHVFASFYTHSIFFGCHDMSSLAPRRMRRTGVSVVVHEVDAALWQQEP